jgi:hypothetical protein
MVAIAVAGQQEQGRPYFILNERLRKRDDVVAVRAANDKPV